MQVHDLGSRGLRRASSVNEAGGVPAWWRAGLVLIVALHVVAVYGPLLFSDHRNVAIFGVINLVAVIIIARLTISGFASVWCGSATVSSVAITLHRRFAKTPSPSTPAQG